MTFLRGAVIIASLCAIALAVVAVRGAQARVVSQALHLELQQVDAKRELWKVQAAIARLRAPDEIRHRVKLIDEQTLGAARNLVAQRELPAMMQ